MAHFDESQFAISNGFVQLTGSSATTYQEDVGTATPAANILNVLGGQGISTSGSGNTITVSSTFEYVQIDNTDSPYTATATDYFISCDSAAGSIIVELPDSPGDFRLFIIKDRTGSASAQNITIKALGGLVTIDGSTTYALTSNFGSINLLFNGTSYEIF